MLRLAQAWVLISVVGSCWLWMMITHECGHVLAALASGGRVARVVVHPLEISRTDLSRNPHPGFVAWMGPVVGCGLPLLALATLARLKSGLAAAAQLFAGFCFIANGAYIGLGSFSAVGDCGELLGTGTPIAALWLFGGGAMAGGLFLWHRLGSITAALRRPPRPSWQLLCAWTTVFVATVAGSWLFSG